MIVYGIDPGVTGAVACLVNGVVHGIEDIPVRFEGSGAVRRKLDSAGLASIVRGWRVQVGPDDELAIVERVGSMPGQGVASTFSLGHSAGAIEGVLQALGIRLQLVPPQSWKRALGIGKDKAKSGAKASLMYPGSAEYWRRVKDHNRAEALLLAHYGWVTQC